MSSRYSRKEAQCSAAAVTVSMDTIVQGLLALSQFLLQLRDEVYIELRNLVLAKLYTSEKYMSICPKCFTLLKSVCMSALPDFLPAIVPSTQTYMYWELYNLDWIVPRHFQCHCSFLQIALHSQLTEFENLEKLLHTTESFGLFLLVCLFFTDIELSD